VAYQRDPVSETWDPAARAILARARRQRGQWVSIVLKHPEPWQITRWAALGIDVPGRDTARGRSARTRWARAFVRAVNYQARGGPPVQVEIGRAVPAVGVIPAGRVARVRVVRHNPDQARAHMARVPDTEKAYDADGRPGGRWADPADRDW
jgi:hypothetical protein